MFFSKIFIFLKNNKKSNHKYLNNNNNVKLVIL